VGPFTRATSIFVTPWIGRDLTSAGLVPHGAWECCNTWCGRAIHRAGIPSNAIHAWASEKRSNNGQPRSNAIRIAAIPEAKGVPMTFRLGAGSGMPYRIRHPLKNIEKGTDARNKRMTIIRRGGSPSDFAIGFHGVPAFLSGQTEHRQERSLLISRIPSVHGVARRGRLVVRPAYGGLRFEPGWPGE